MPDAVYLHDGERQITVRFPTQEDRERFKTHYRHLDALGVQFREERDQARAAVRILVSALRGVLHQCPDTADPETYNATMWGRPAIQWVFDGESVEMIEVAIDALTDPRVTAILSEEAHE